MSERDASLAKPGDIASAIALLTRLPVIPGPRDGAKTSWAWPVVGAIVGILAWFVAILADAFGLPPYVSAGLALGILVLVTGALHEDGLADSADGLWGGADPNRRLAIMKDSRIGSYGVIALILSIGLRWFALAELIDAGTWHAAAVISAAMASRAAMAGVMAYLPSVREEGMSFLTGRPGKRTVLLGVAISFATGIVILNLLVLLLAAVAVCAVAYGIAELARRKLGGQTGDIIGATQQSTEISVLLIALALA